jgi:hypothetical protein
MSEPQVTEADPVVLRARRVWDDLAAAALAKPLREGRAIDEEAIVERVTAELAEVIGAHELEVAAMRAEIEDLQRRANPAPRPTGTPDQWAQRLAASQPLTTQEIERFRGDALRRLAAIGITSSDVIIVKLANQTLASKP